jgi:hypothetical protein
METVKNMDFLIVAFSSWTEKNGKEHPVLLTPLYPVMFM